MRVVVQRVGHARVRVADETVGEIGPGLLLLVGVGRDDPDDPSVVERLARRLVNLRVFADPDGRMQRSVLETGGAVLVVPNFTVLGDARRGRRPSWDAAAAPEVAAGRVASLADAIAAHGVPVARGAFREHMEVDLRNDGPVTLVVEEP